MSGAPGPAEAVPALTSVLPPLSSVKTPGAPSSMTSASMVWLMPEPLMRIFTVVVEQAGITVSRVVSVSVDAVTGLDHEQGVVGETVQARLSCRR